MNEMVMLFTIERICNCDMIPKHVTCSLKRPPAVLVRCASIILESTTPAFRCLPPFISSSVSRGGY